MATASNLLYDWDVLRTAESLYNTNQSLSEDRDEHAALRMSQERLVSFDMLSRVSREDEYWGQYVDWPDEPSIGARLLSLSELQTVAEARIEEKRETASRYLSMLSEVFIDEVVSTPAPHVAYLPTRLYGRPKGSKQIRRDFRVDPIEGKVIDVNLNGWVPAKFNSDFHGENLPAVTIQHRLSRLSLHTVESTLPLLVLDAQENLQPNFI